MEDAKTASIPIEINIKITKEMCPRSQNERTTMKNRPYREVVGRFVYLSNTTCPNIAFAASTLSRLCTDPGESHWFLAKRVL